ncbi:hypothetical protein DESACE_00285 [Desulfurella acetivorans A63]|nr:hypothetical protein DESACE_00285 [Desulfurella acetivorans A63]
MQWYKVDPSLTLRMTGFADAQDDWFGLQFSDDKELKMTVHKV